MTAQRKRSMKFNRMILAAGSIIFSVISSHAWGQNYQIVGDGRFAEINGRIEADSDERFLSFLNSNPDLIGLRLNSPGGVVVSALAMAEEISRRQLSTYIGATDICASACSILFFAGHDRLVEGRLGIHQMDDGGQSNASTLQFVLADQLDAFERYGVPWSLTRQMLTTPPWDMYWITEYEISSFGLNRDLPGSALAVDIAAAPAAPDQAATAMSFADYPSVPLSGALKLPNFGGRDADYRMYRTRIGNGAAQGVNFAGHYAMIEIGCGTSCRFAFIVDLQTGRVGSFPYGGEEQYQMGMIYLPESRLLKVRWAISWDSNDCIEKDMLIEGLEWQEIGERTVPATNGFCSYD